MSASVQFGPVPSVPWLVTMQLWLPSQVSSASSCWTRPRARVPNIGAPGAAQACALLSWPVGIVVAVFRNPARSSGSASSQSAAALPVVPAARAAAHRAVTLWNPCRIIPNFAEHFIYPNYPKGRDNHAISTVYGTAPADPLDKFKPQVRTSPSIYWVPSTQFCVACAADILITQCVPRLLQPMEYLFSVEFRGIDTRSWGRYSSRRQARPPWHAWLPLRRRHRVAAKAHPLRRRSPGQRCRRLFASSQSNQQR